MPAWLPIRSLKCSGPASVLERRSPVSSLVLLGAGDSTCRAFLAGGRASTFLIMGPTAVAAISIPSLPQCPASLKKQNICGRNIKFTQMQMLWLELRVAFASSFLLSGNIENESLFQNSVLLESTYGGSSMQ